MSAAAPAGPTLALEFKLLDERALPPRRARPGDAGVDLAAVEDFALQPGERRVVGTGVAIALPDGMAGLLLPRSGLAARHGITMVNAPGLVDPNYRGECRIVLLNTGGEPFSGHRGDRIAQLLLVPYVAVEPTLVDELAPSGDDRGANGFGSSGR